MDKTYYLWDIPNTVISTVGVIVRKEEHATVVITNPGEDTKNTLDKLVKGTRVKLIYQEVS